MGSSPELELIFRNLVSSVWTRHIHNSLPHCRYTLYLQNLFLHFMYIPLSFRVITFSTQVPPISYTKNRQKFKVALVDIRLHVRMAPEAEPNDTNNCLGFLFVCIVLNYRPKGMKNSQQLFPVNPVYLNLGYVWESPVVQIGILARCCS